MCTEQNQPRIFYDLCFLNMMGSVPFPSGPRGEIVSICPLEQSQRTWNVLGLIYTKSQRDIPSHTQVHFFLICFFTFNHVSLMIQVSTDLLLTISPNSFCLLTRFLILIWSTARSSFLLVWHIYEKRGVLEVNLIVKTVKNIQFPEKINNHVHSAILYQIQTYQTKANFALTV